jgi:hypothetical protein
MSVQALRWVLEHSTARNADRLVLISLAYHAGADGGHTFPSIGTIAREARLGESTVRRSIEALVKLGEINEDGLGPKRTRCFRIVMREGTHPEREVRRRPGQPAPHERQDPADPAPPDPAGSAPPQDLRDPAGSSTLTPQILRSDPAGSAAEPSVTVIGTEIESPVVNGRAKGSNNGNDEERTLVDKIVSILQGGIDSIPSEEEFPEPSALKIHLACLRLKPSAMEALAAAQDARGTIQSQGWVKNAAKLFENKLEQIVQQRPVAA